MKATLSQVRNLIFIGTSKANKRINDKSIFISYSLDIESKTVSITKQEREYKMVTVHGHIGGGSKWKKKDWVDIGVKSVIFTGKVRDALEFLNEAI
jgi:hypothetical protein